MSVPEDNDALMEAAGVVYPTEEGQLYELHIVATGEVRDADGNLVSPATAESTRTVTEAEALAIIGGTDRDYTVAQDGYAPIPGDEHEE